MKVSQEEILSNKIKQSDKKSLKNTNLPISIVGLLLCLFVYAVLKYEDVVDEQPDGTVILKPEREAKLKEGIKKIEKCTQYALVATEDGWFPCYTCTNGKNFIFLSRGEIWKYGYTCEKDIKKDRYKGDFPAQNLEAIPQFKGFLQECKVEELRKIFNYPICLKIRKGN